MDWLRQIPIGQYVPNSGSWLGQLDARQKLAWTLAFLLTPILAGPLWRLALVGLLLLLTAVSGLPLRLWGKGVGLLLALALAVGVLAAVLPTGGLPAAPLQRPPSELRLEPGPPQTPPPQSSGAAWVLARLGPLQVNRRSLELGLSGGTLLFTLVHSANLMLLTTPPEAATPNTGALDEVARGLEYLTFIDALPEAQDHGTPLGEARFELTGGLTIQIRCSRLDQFLFIRLTAEGMEAERWNARWQGWAYQLGIWKEKAFLPTLEELTQSP